MIRKKKKTKDPSKRRIGAPTPLEELEVVSRKEIKELAELNMNRRKNKVGNTATFINLLKRMEAINCCVLSTEGMSRLLLVNNRTVMHWEEVGLIFPRRLGKQRIRGFRLKDILRGLTIKYLMSELGYRKYAGVKLTLELAHKALYAEDRTDSLDNIRIDQYLMTILNYNIESIATMKLHGNWKKGLSDNIESEDEDDFNE